MIQEVVSDMIQFLQPHVSPAPVLSGGSFGFMVRNPSIQIPYVAVEIEDIQSAQVELGSEYLEGTALLTIYAASQQQRDYMKRRISNALLVSGFNTCERIDDFFVQDVPNLDDERYYWVANITFRFGTFLT